MDLNFENFSTKSCLKLPILDYYLDLLERCLGKKHAYFKSFNMPVYQTH